MAKSNNAIPPVFLIIAGITEAIIPCIILFVTIPQLLNLWREHHLPINPITTFGPILFTIAVILSQVVFGIKLRKKQKLMGKLDDRDNTIAILLLISGGLTFIFGISLSVFFIITPIYELLSTIK